MSASNVLQSVADQINAGAIGPDVTASVSGPSERVQKLADKITAMGPEMVEKAQAAITLLRDTPDKPKAPASASSILPDLVSAKLEAIGEAESNLQWAIGDATIELVAELYPRFPKAEIRAAVATRAQLQPSAVRAREATARYWDEADRAEFEGLSYSHFRLAARQPDPRADMTFCLDSADDYAGQPMPYHAYAAWVRDRKGGPEEPTPTELLERAIVALTKYRDVAEGRHHARANEALGVLEAIQ